MDRINEIYSMIQKLDYHSKRKLAKRMKYLLDKAESEPPVKLYDLKGLGAEIWKDTDIEGYIATERQWD